MRKRQEAGPALARPAPRSETSLSCAALCLTYLRPAFRKEAPAADYGDRRGAVGTGGDGPGALRGELGGPSGPGPHPALEGWDGSCGFVVWVPGRVGWVTPGPSSSLAGEARAGAGTEGLRPGTGKEQVGGGAGARLVFRNQSWD